MGQVPFAHTHGRKIYGNPEWMAMDEDSNMHDGWPLDAYDDPFLLGATEDYYEVMSEALWNGSIRLDGRLVYECDAVYLEENPGAGLVWQPCDEDLMTYVREGYTSARQDKQGPRKFKLHHAQTSQY